MPNSATPPAPSQEATARLRSAIRQTDNVPFYSPKEWQSAFALPFPQLADLPRITKSQLREHSPEGFLPAGMEVKTLLDQGLIEEESTSGTSGASVRVVFGKTWWAEQERRALVRNPFLADLFAAGTDLRRAVLTAPGCSGVSCYNRWLSLEQRTLGDSLFVNQSRIPFTLGEAKLDGMAKEARLPRRRSGARRLVRALLRTSRAPLPFTPVHPDELRIHERRPPYGDGTRLRRAGDQPLWLQRDRPSARRA